MNRLKISGRKQSPPDSRLIRHYDQSGSRARQFRERGCDAGKQFELIGRTDIPGIRIQRAVAIEKDGRALQRQMMMGPRRLTADH